MPKQGALEEDPQAGMFDLEVEDHDLERLLEEANRMKPMATAYRAAKKGARQRLEELYKNAINVVGEHDGWVRCGKYRFRAESKERKAGSVNIGAGFNFTLDIEHLD